MISSSARDKHDTDTRPPSGGWDAVIIGAGVAGLTSAALLASTGRRVLLLEAIHYPGGCASSYVKDGCVYDVGATTFSGTETGHPLDTLFGIIGAFDQLLLCDPPMGIVMDGHMLLRHIERKAWLRETQSFFGSDQTAFWYELRDWSDVAYRLMASVPYLPPRSLYEVLSNAGQLRFDTLRHLPHLFSTIGDRMRKHGIAEERFIRFIDAQLLITSQASSSRVPFLAGALGLTYTDFPVYSVRGGMLTYARFLGERVRYFGGEIRYLQRVNSITREGRMWRVRTKQGGDVTAPMVVSTLPVFNLPALLDEAPLRYASSLVSRIFASGVSLWSALTIYACVPAAFAEALPVNLQVILPAELELSGSSTLFCSFSHPADESRAPAGFRTLTVSTHIHRDHPALRADSTAVRAWKERASAEIIVALRANVPEFAALELSHFQSGSPRTFQKYTGRVEGLVGGLPLDRSLFPFKFPTPFSPFDGLYLQGDTIFPGQGLPGVTLGALSLYKRLLASAA